MKPKVLLVSIPVFLALSAALVYPLSILVLSPWDSRDYDIPGQALSDSPFASLQGAKAQSSILPESFVTLSTDPLILHESYERFENASLVGYSSALETAENWLSSVGPKSITWTLVGNSSLDTPPSWRFVFTFPGFSAFVIVERVTGRVIEYSMKYLHDFDPTPLTVDEAEALSLDFLRSQNYSIPTSARYMGGFPYDCWRFYEITLQEFVNNVAVPQSQIVVTASAFFRGISYFRYHWLGLGALDTGDFVSPSFAWNSALSREDVQGDIIQNGSSMISAALTFVTITHSGQPSHPSFRLAWELDAEEASNNTTETRLYSSPTSGALFGYSSEREGYQPVEYVQTFYSIPVLVALVALSSVVLVAMVGGLIYHSVKD